MPGAGSFRPDELTFGSLKRTRPRLRIDVHESQLVLVALLSPNVESGADLFIAALPSNPFVDIGFDVNGEFQPSVRLEPGGQGHLVARPREVPSGTPLPEAVELRCRVTEVLPRTGGARQFEDSLVVEVQLVSIRLQPLEIELELPGLVDLSGLDSARSDPAIAVVATLLLSQASAGARYAGPPQRLRVTPQAWLEERAIESTALRTRICHSALGGWENGFWRGGFHDVALPLTYANHEAKHSRLEIGLSERELKSLVRDIAGVDAWRGLLRLNLVVERVDAEDATFDARSYPVEIELAMDLGATIDIDIAGVGSASVQFGSLEAPPRTRIAPYKRTVRASGAVYRNNIQSELVILLAADARDRDPRVDLNVRLESGEGWVPVVNIPDQAPAARPAEVRVPFGSILEKVGLTRPSSGAIPRTGVIELTLSYHPAADCGPTGRAVVEIPIEIETTAPEWLACIDLGTSSTAIWLGQPNVAGQPSRPLPLGFWLSKIDPGHEEWSTDREDQDQILIPSHVGLGSGSNLRARFDPLSLGDLSLASEDQRTVGRRLAALRRHYDVSVPFVPRASIPDHVQEIVFDPKRRLIAPVDKIPAPGGVYRASPGGDAQTTTDVVLADLLADYFDELGSYVVPRTLQEMAEFRDGRSKDLLERWIAGLGGLGAVLTHPSGIADPRKLLYEQAGRQFLAALNGPAALPMAGTGWVKLVPEALAAARYGIGDAITRHKLQNGLHSFGAIDIGAGTFDVTLVDALVHDGAPESWTVRSHFGVTVGGLDLDRAIAARVRGVLEAAAVQLRRDGLFEFELDLPSTATDLHDQADPVARARGQNFLRELQSAKQNLTKALLRESAYDWTLAKDVRLNIAVGEAARMQDWPVRTTQQALGARGYDRLQIADFDAALIIDRQAEVSARVILSLGASVFEGVQPIPRRDDPRTLVEFMGEVLVAMTIAEARRMGMPPPRWIITGRAALWPPLYQAIERTIDAHAGAAGVMSREMPYPPDTMKKAVLLGAIGLAQEPHLSLGADVLNSLAVVSYGGAGEGADRIGAFDLPVIKSVRYIDASRNADGTLKLETRGRFAIVRALPGLDDEQTRDRWMRVFQEMGIPPWVSIGGDIFPIHSRPGADQSYQLHWRRRGSRIWITILDEAAGETLPIGPIDCDGRIYGDF